MAIAPPPPTAALSPFGGQPGVWAKLGAANATDKPAPSRSAIIEGLTYISKVLSDTPPGGDFKNGAPGRAARSPARLSGSNAGGNSPAFRTNQRRCNCGGEHRFAAECSLN